MTPRSLLCIALAFAAIGGSALLAQEGKEEAPPAAPAAPALLPWLENHEEAAKLAKEKNLLIITDLYTEWCGWCTKLEKETYPAPEVQEALKGFVLLKLNPEKNAFGKELMTNAGVRGFPATLVTDAEWNLVKMISGYKPPGPYVEELKGALEELKKFEALRQPVLEGKADDEARFQYLKRCDELGRKAEIRTHGPKALEPETGEHHADVAYYLAKAFGPAAPEFAKYKELSLKFDAENRAGYHDAFVLDEAMAVLNSGKSKEEMPPLMEKAIGIVEARTSQASPAPHKEKGQMLLWILAQLHFQGRKDKAKAVELLKKGIALNPESPLGQQMAKMAQKIGG
jgi:thioredoxin-related protein